MLKPLSRFIHTASRWKRVIFELHAKGVCDQVCSPAQGNRNGQASLGVRRRRTVLIHRTLSFQSGTGAPSPPRDLVDFHLRWAEYRPLMVALQGQQELSPDQAETLGWLIALSDRVSAQDIS
jgi:hypothetical protein